MNKDERADIFFLKASDDLSKTGSNPVGKSILTYVVDKQMNMTKFTNVQITKEKGYFVIDASSTIPTFAAKMKELITFLKLIKTQYKVVMVYLNEAHADDIWPLGYGINSAKDLDEKWQNCDSLMKKWPELH